MMYECPDHPEIVSMERTGYPSWMQEEDVFCDYCGDEITEEVYEDEHHDKLCEHCLLKLHLKEVW